MHTGGDHLYGRVLPRGPTPFLGSLTTLLQTDRRTVRVAPSKSAQVRPRSSLLRSPVNAAHSTTVRAGSGRMTSMDFYFRQGISIGFFRLRPAVSKRLEW